MENGQTSTTDQLRLQYNALQDQLAVYQDNYAQTVSISDKLKEQLAILKGLKWINEENGEETKKQVTYWEELKQAMVPVVQTFKPIYDALQPILSTMLKIGTASTSAFNIPQQKFDTLDMQWSAFLDGLLKKYETVSSTMGMIAKSAAEAGSQAFSDFFFDVLTGKFEDLRSYLMSFWQSMARALADMMAKQMVASMFGKGLTGAGSGEGPGGGGGGGGGAEPAGQTGGIVTGPKGIDRVPIRASAGEMMLNQRQQANLFNMIRSGTGGSGGTVIVNNNISALDGADAYRTFDRNKDALVAVIKKSQMGGRRGT